jgi:hypothetical protein
MSNNRCKYCGSRNVKKKGVTNSNAQRWLCLKCNKSWSKARTKYKNYSSIKMFGNWLDGDSMSYIQDKNKLSKSHTYRILMNELNKEVYIDEKLLANAKNIAFDGKFLFGRKHTVLVVYDANINKPIAMKFCTGETRKNITPFLLELKQKGLNPLSVTMDGKGTIKSCFKNVFPDIIIQRCLFHLILQINSWVRIPARTPFGKAMHFLVNDLMKIENSCQVNEFLHQYETIKYCFYKELEYFKEMKNHNRKAFDLTKCISLLDNATKDMFSYVYRPEIPNTTSGLEGFNKKISKIKGFDHCGLTEQHIEKFLGHFVAHQHQK